MNGPAERMYIRVILSNVYILAPVVWSVGVKICSFPCSLRGSSNHCYYNKLIEYCPQQLGLRDCSSPSRYLDLCPNPPEQSRCVFNYPVCHLLLLSEVLIDNRYSIHSTYLFSYFHQHLIFYNLSIFYYSIPLCLNKFLFRS